MNLNEYINMSTLGVKSLTAIETEIVSAVEICKRAISSKNTIFFCGNGGSAAEAQHFAAEFLGKFLIDRSPLPAFALTVDTSALTAIGNDFGFEEIFSRQLMGIAKPNDVLIGLSTSGNSRNVVKAFQAAKKINVSTISLTNASPCSLDDLSDIAIKPDVIGTNFIQEAHLVIGHYICMKVEEAI